MTIINPDIVMGSITMSFEAINELFALEKPKVIGTFGG